MTLQSLTETSRTAILHEEVLQDSSAPIQAPILHVHITLQSREFSIQNPILHAEDKELFEYYYYIQRAKRPSLQKRNSTHRRQGDLLEMHPCVLQDLPMTFQTFQSFQTLQRHSRHSSHSWPSSLSRQFYNVPVSPGNPSHSSILRLECIFYNFYIFYSSIGFHKKTPPSTSWAITVWTFILQRKGDVAISVKLTDYSK